MVRFFVVSRFLLRAALSVLILASGDAFSRTVTYDLLWETGSGSFGDAALSPDGESIAVGGSLGLRLVDAVDERVIRRFEEPSRSIAALAFSPDGKTLLAGTRSNDAVLWDIETGRALHILSGHPGSVTIVSFSRDGKTILTGSSDPAVRLWSAETGELLRTVDSKFVLKSAKMSPDGNSIYMVSSNHYERYLYHLNDSNGFYEAHQESYYGNFDFFLDGSGICMVYTYDDWYSRSPTFAIFNSDTGNYLRLFCVSPEVIKCQDMGPFVFSPNGEFALFGDKTSNIYVLKRDDSGMYVYVRKHSFVDQRIVSFQFSADGKRVLTKTKENDVILWDFETGERIGGVRDYFHSPRRAAFSADGESFIVTYSDRIVERRDLTDYSIRTSIRTGVNDVLAALSRDGSKIATSYPDKSVAVWDAHSGEFIQSLEISDVKYYLLKRFTFTYDSQKLMVLSTETTDQYDPIGDQIVSVFDLSSYERISRFENLYYSIRALFSTPDNASFITVGNWIERWSLSAGELLCTYWTKPTPRAFRNAVMSLDGVFCAVIDFEGNICIANVEEDTYPYNPEFAGADFGYEFVFHPTEDQLVFCDARGGVLFWDFKEDREVKYFEGDFPKLKWLDISPDGERMFTLSTDDTLRLWDLTTETGVGDWREY